MHSIVMSHRSALLTRHNRTTAHVRLERLLHSLLAVAPRRNEEFVYHVYGYTHHRRTSNGPAHLNAPRRIVELLAKHFLIAQYREYKYCLQ